MDHMVTKTMAELYLKQGHLREAYEIYQALAETDPFDPEMQERVKELKEKLHPSPPLKFSHPLSSDERIRYPEKWLANIRKRRGSRP